jgi:hypothetical protein
MRVYHVGPLPNNLHEGMDEKCLRMTADGCEPEPDSAMNSTSTTSSYSVSGSGATANSILMALMIFAGVIAAVLAVMLVRGKRDHYTNQDKTDGSEDGTQLVTAQVETARVSRRDGDVEVVCDTR